MKKFLLPVISFAAISVVTSVSAASYAVKNLDLNDGGSNFVRNLTVSASGSEVNVRAFVVPLPGFDRPHRVNITGIPAGMVVVSHSVSDSDCASISNVSATSAGASYDFPGDCDGVFSVKYRTAGVALGEHVLSATVTDCGSDGTCGNSDDSSSSTNAVTLSAYSKAVLVRAVTLDSDSDGFLDGYDFFFNLTPSSGLGASQVRARVDSKFASSVSYVAGTGARGTLHFSNGTFSTAEIPRIEIDADANYEAGTYYVGVAEDGAAPLVSVSKPAGTYTGSITVSLSSSESGSLRYAFGTGAASASSSQYVSPITINSGTVLSTYAADYAGNSKVRNFSYSFVCSNSAPSNGTLTAYPACSITCNSGYVLSGSSCVLASGSSSGGSSSGGSSSGGSSSGGSSSGGSSSGGSSSGGASAGTSAGVSTDPARISSATGDIRYFSSLSGALAYLDVKITDISVKKAYSGAVADIVIPDSEYYLSFDSALKTEYNRVINAFVLTYVLKQKSNVFVLTSTEQADMKWASDILKSAAIWTKKVHERCVSVVTYGTGVTVYRTKFQLIQKALLKLEKKYVGKFDKLLVTGTIDRTKYLFAIDGWNRFVLHLSVFRTFGGLEAAKIRAIAAIRDFEPIYKKRARITVSSPSPSAPVATVPASVPQPSQTTDSSVAFTKDVSYGETSDDVRRLQTFLKDAGYFGTLSPTGYFGPSTKTSLSKYSSEVLKIDNPNGTLSGKVRDAVNERLRTK